MDIYSDEFLSLIKALNDNNTRYIIVGGFSTNFHGYKRATGDIDFWIDDTFANRQNLIKTFDQLKIGYFEELLTAPLIAGYCEVLLDSGLYADFMNTIIGFEKEDFNTCFEMAIVTKISDISIRFLHYNHLLQSKEQSSRPKDILDAQELKKINKK
jgi:hypothetical protein